MRSLLLLLFLFCSTLAFSQNNNLLLPVKINHKWGYINLQGDTIIQPKYDALGDMPLIWNRFLASESPYKLVELDGKIGAIDWRGTEILAPDYQQIRPLNDSLFAVEIDSLFTVVNRQGEVLMEERHEDIYLMMADGAISMQFFLIKKGKKWGVYERNKGLVFPPKYGYVEYTNAGKGYFLIKKDRESGFWGVIDKQGNVKLNIEFSEAKVYSDNFFAGKTGGETFAVWDSLGNQVLEKKWRRFHNLNPHFIAMRHENWDWQLFQKKTSSVFKLSKDYNGFGEFNNDYILCQKGEKWGLLDSLGREIVTPQFAEIRPFNDSLLQVKQKYWGLYSLKEGLIIPCEYQAITSYKGDLMLVIKDKSRGLINLKNEMLIPPEFDNFQVEGDFLKAFKGKSMTMFEIDSVGQILSEEFYPLVQTLRVGYDLDNLQGEFTWGDLNNAQAGRNLNIRPTFSFSDWVAPDTTTIEDTDWNWVKNRRAQAWELRQRSTNEVVSPPIYHSVRHIARPQLTMVFNPQKIISNRLSGMALFPVDTACSMALFSHKLGKFITPFNMMGLRRNDFEQGLPYAAFLDEEGKFGLIDIDGVQAKNKDGEPLRFSFIGWFRNGKARVCIGGKISPADQPQDHQMSPGPFMLFNSKFFLSYIRDFGAGHEQPFFFEKMGYSEPKWGYIDTVGNLVIDAEYTYASGFDKGRAINKKDEGWGLINEENEVLLDFLYSSISEFRDSLWKIAVANSKPIFFNKKGHEIIGLEYQRFGGFRNGMCRVQRDSLWGFVNAAGEEVISCQYQKARDFSEGLAAIYEDGKWFFIDKKGDIALLPEQTISGILDVGNFNNGLCWYQVGFHYGFMDKKGKVKIDADFTKAFDFKHGVARVVYNAKTGLINPKGKWVLKPRQFEVILEFDENGLAEVREKFHQPRGVINLKGELLTPLKYTGIDPFINGYARVSDGKGYGCIDSTGKEVIPLVYENVSEFSDGLVAVMPKNKRTWHYRDAQNERAFNGEFEIAEPYHQGYTFVQVHEDDPLSKIWLDKKGRSFNPVTGDQVQNFSDGLFGMYNSWGRRIGFRRLHYYYADKFGKNPFNRYFEGVETFLNGTAPAKLRGRWGVYNDKGIFVVPPKYAKINQMEDGLIHVRPSLLFGVATKDGQILVPPAYDFIDAVQRQVLRVERGEAVGYMDFLGEWVWELGR